MSEKQSFVIIGIVLAVLVVCVYYFSVPKAHMHLAPVVGDSSEKSLPAKDSEAKPDSASLK